MPLCLLLNLQRSYVKTSVLVRLPSEPASKIQYLKIVALCLLMKPQRPYVETGVLVCLPQEPAYEIQYI